MAASDHDNVSKSCAPKGGSATWMLAQRTPRVCICVVLFDANQSEAGSDRENMVFDGRSRLNVRRI